ncbi:MAG: 3-ketoacyl-ACP reductase [Saprospiraceae bacterium]|nr:3-ketoacyl-ACP reductase [Saprospiraceae bacterium]
MNKVALITGGSRGIGYGIATYLAAQGYDLAINGIRPEQDAEPALEKLRAMGGQVIYCPGNIALEEDRQNMIENIKARMGRLHILINNAGVAPKERNDILRASADSYDYVMDTNLKGPYFLTQAVSNWMIEQKEKDVEYTAQIIIVSSISAVVASTNRGEYCLSKAGLAMMTQLFAVRMSEYNIPVYEIRPGIIKSDMTAGVTEKYDKLIAGGLTLQPRWGTPSDVGKAVAAIAMGHFPYSTGQIFMVDGGLTLLRL